MKIVNGIIEGDLLITKDSLSEFINNVPNIKQINGNLELNKLNLDKLPNMSDIIINGDFDCYSNKLVDLIGCPKIIIKSFNCTHNNLISLEGCPNKIGLLFECNFNKNLKTLEFFPESIKYVNFDKEILNEFTYKKLLTLSNKFFEDISPFEGKCLMKNDLEIFMREHKLNKILE